MQRATYGPHVDESKIVAFERMTDIKTDADADAFVRDVKAFPDTMDALFWLGCLRSCTNWHCVIGGVGFSRYTNVDETEEDDETPQKSRVKGCVVPISGAKARLILQEEKLFTMRVIKEGDPKAQHGYIHSLNRKDFRPMPGDKPLSNHIWFRLIPFKFDPRHWPQPLAFNRGAWPAPFRLPSEAKATVKLAL